MLRAGVFSPCPFQQHWVGDRLSPVASLTKVRELRFALFNFCSLYSRRMMPYAFSFMEHSLGVVQSPSDISLSPLPAFFPPPLTSFHFFSPPSSTSTTSFLMCSVSRTLIASEVHVCMRRITGNYICHMRWVSGVFITKLYIWGNSFSFLSNFKSDYISYRAYMHM